MLQTVNGFDLMLVIIIVSLCYNVVRLNRECRSYVGQLIKLSWELQATKVPQLDHDLLDEILGCDCGCQLPL